MGTMPENKNEQNFQVNYGLNLSLLEEKVVRLVDLVQELKQAKITLQKENLILQEEIQFMQKEVQELQEENQMLKHQLMRAENSLVSETKDLEELSQEKMMTKMIVDDLIRSIDSLVEQKD